MTASAYQPPVSQVAVDLRRFATTSWDAPVEDDGAPGLWEGVERIGVPELNVVPLVDVLFLLMIFFVISGTFGLGEGILASRMLPAGSGEGGVPLPFSPIVVEFLAPAADSKNVEIRVAGNAGPVNSLADLAVTLAQMRAAMGFDSFTPVVIKSDDDVPWDVVAGGWNAAVVAGFRDIGFAAVSANRRSSPEN